jgi:Icc-related predicted phosphoesterase
MEKQKDKIRLAAIGDIHYGRTQDSLQPAFAQIAATVDILLLLGDLTNTGLPEEAKKLARDLTSSVKIPIIGVLGNHDFESGRQIEVRDVLREAGVTILDGEAHEVLGIGFAGVKGFAGGFDRSSLQPWGEDIIKLFVREAVNEALKLEAALAKLRTVHRIALLHYSPIRATVEGEPLEIFPYLGSSRLEEPLNRYQVMAALHGHAHRGAFEGATQTKIPVYNVSMSVLQKAFPDRPPFHILEVPVSTPATDQQPQPASPNAVPA